MRGPVTASASVVIFTAALGACAPSRLPPPPREPPARVLAVGLDWISLRANAYVELHASLAAAARGASLPPAGLDTAVTVYRRALADDDADELLARSTRALSTCTDDRCAEAALAPTPFAGAFARSLGPFAAAWTERATTTRSAIEVVRGVLSAETDGLFRRLEEDLAVATPHDPALVDVVAEAPPAGREAIFPVVLGARSGCFRKVPGARRVQDTHVIDCVFAHALRAVRRDSAIAAVLDRELGPIEGARAWDVLVCHAVATTLAAWERAHVSPMRRSAAAIEPRVLEWLAERWAGRASGETPAPSFGAAYAEAWRARARARDRD